MTVEVMPDNPTDEDRRLMAVRVAHVEGISIEAARRKVDRLVEQAKREKG